jgi:hypothetical protein
MKTALKMAQYLWMTDVRRNPKGCTANVKQEFLDTKTTLGHLPYGWCPKVVFRWRRGRDSNTQHLSVHYISNVAPYQLEYLSNWQYDRSSIKELYNYNQGRPKNQAPVFRKSEFPKNLLNGCKTVINEVK